MINIIKANKEVGQYPETELYNVLAKIKPEELELLRFKEPGLTSRFYSVEAFEDYLDIAEAVEGVRLRECKLEIELK